MATINKIQNALKELDGAIFQKLADSYLLRKGYPQIIPTGSALGKNKTKTGTPDTLILLENGKYVFVEYTTEGKGVLNKFLKDIKKDLDEEKTGIPIEKIQEIILCFNTDLRTKEHEKLRVLCEKDGVNLNIYGNGSISFDLLEKYPSIAKDYLGIEVDTGQIIPLGSFIKLYETSKLATTLQTGFHFREKEKEKLNALIQSKDLVIVSGKAGTGKTRLAIESYRDFLENNKTYKEYCIFNQGVDLFDDIKSYFSDSGNYLIFVDDANRVSGFQYIIHLLRNKREDQEFKVIATVRDYAFDKIQGVCNEISSIGAITIESLTDDEIKSLVKEEFGIVNYLFLDRIADIAQGNPRIAIMAAKIARDTDTLNSIRDVSQLYDSYYSSIRTDLEKLKNQNILKVAGIVSFFRHVDSSNEKMMSEIAESFGISADDFWVAAKQLHDMEVLDMFEDEVVKVSDQVFATYLFYLVFFKDQLIDFGILITHFFPAYKHRLIDAISPILNSFDVDKIKKSMIPCVDNIWMKLQDSNEQAFIQLLNVFWFLKPTDALVYFNNKIDELETDAYSYENATKDIPCENIGFEDETNTLPDYLSCLPKIRLLGEDELSMSLDLLLKYLEKKPLETPAVLKVLTDEYGFEPESSQYKYYVQHTVINKLMAHLEIGKNEVFTDLFIFVAKNYLQTQFYIYRSERRNALTTINFSLVSSEELLTLRKNIINALLQVYKSTKKHQSAILNLLVENFQFNRKTSDNIIVLHDAELLMPFLKKELDPNNLNHCITIKKLITSFERWNVPVNKEIHDMLQSELYKLYDLFLDKINQFELSMSSEESSKYKKKIINEITAKFDEKEYLDFFQKISTIKELVTNTWSIDQGVILIFQEVAEKDSDLFFSVVDIYLQNGDFLKVNPYSVVSRLFSSVGSYHTNRIIFKNSFNSKETWLVSYYFLLPAEEIQQDDITTLLGLYKEAKCLNITNSSFDYLLKYEEKEKGTIQKVVSIILDRANKELEFGHLLCSLFNPFNDIFSFLPVIFSGNFELLEDSYLKIDSQHCDHDGKALNLLLNNNLGFSAKYIESLASTKAYLSAHDDNRDYSFIWHRKDAFDLMTIITACVYKHEQDGKVYKYYPVFFGKRFGDEYELSQNDKARIKQDEFLDNEISQNYSDSDYIRFIFSVISMFSPKRKLNFFKTFLDKNKNFDDFEKLQVEPSSFSSEGVQGSFVPVFQKRILFLQELASICNVVELLKHKQYLEEMIRYWRKRIRHEKKRDFTESFY